MTNNFDVKNIMKSNIVLCGQCKFSNISKSIPCAYICIKKNSPCYKRVTYADFGCLYGENKL